MCDPSVAPLRKRRYHLEQGVGYGRSDRPSSSSRAVVRGAVQDLICTVQVQPGKGVLDDAAYTAPTRQHELDHTISGIDLLCLADLDHVVDYVDHTDHTDHTYHVSEVCSCSTITCIAYPALFPTNLAPNTWVQCCRSRAVTFVKSSTLRTGGETLWGVIRYPLVWQVLLFRCGTVR